MLKKWKSIALDDAKAGMVLAEAIRDGSGGVLLLADTLLTDSLISSLCRRGIDTLLVIDDTISEEELRAEHERVMKRLDQLFRKVAPASAGALLRNAIRKYRIERTP